MAYVLYSRFDQHGYYTGAPLPKDCIVECSAAGDVQQAVTYWRERLRFIVPRELAIAWLREFGAWEIAELTEATAETLANRVLWLACCELRESGDWLGLVH